MHVKAVYPGFAATMSKAIALLKSCVAEVKSRELPIKSALSFVVVSDEFETAGEILKSSSNEVLVRASGVIAGVALERHFRTVAEERNITVVKKPPARRPGYLLKGLSRTNRIFGSNISLTVNSRS